MTDAFVADTSAVVDYIREDRPTPPQMIPSARIYLPLPAVGELFAGAYRSDRTPANLQYLEATIGKWSLLYPDIDTARVYGRIRTALRTPVISQSKLNDLWIAAIAIQHDLPLLVKDRGFDAITGLKVLHW